MYFFHYKIYQVHWSKLLSIDLGLPRLVKNDRVDWICIGFYGKDHPMVMSLLGTSVFVF